MFEKIHFIENQHFVLTPHNMIHEIEASPSDNAQQSVIHAKEQLSHKFNLDGRIRILFPDSDTPTDPEHYFYPQIFCLFECGPNYYTKRDNYNSYEIVFTYSGTGYLEYDGKSYTIEPGCGFFIDCRKPHFYKTQGETWEHSVLHFNGSISEKLYAEYASYGDVTFHDALDGNYHSHVENLLNIWDHFQIYKDLQISNTICDIVTYLLLLKAMDEHSDVIKVPETITYLSKYMRHNFSSNITLDFLADFANVSKYHLTREFKKYMGTTPIQYLISVRIMNAKFMLIHTPVPISVIAEESGFSDINNFNRLFLKNVGMAPRDYRKQHDPLK